MHNVLGGVIDAHAAYLLLRGMKTLGLRVEHQNRCGGSSSSVAAQLARALLQFSRQEQHHSTAGSSSVVTQQAAAAPAASAMTVQCAVAST